MKARQARIRYAHPAKVTARDLVLAAAADNNVESILDLWGGGASANLFREAMPEAAIVSCERDRNLWPALTQDAQLKGYGYHLGDLSTVQGRFDLVWLDLCSQWSASARESVVAAASHVSDGGMLAVTLLAARENPEIAADRLFLVPKSIERASGLSVRLLFPYQTASPMWLLLLYKDKRWSWWHDEPERVVRMRGSNPDHWQWWIGKDGFTPYREVVERIEQDGFFACSSIEHGRLYDAMERAVAERKSLAVAA